MIDFQKLAVEEALRSQLGKTAEFSLYGRQHRTPMSLVIGEVEREIGALFSVYWVDNGPPEVFCLPGFSPSPVVFSTRYLSLTAFIRHLFVDEWLKNVLVDVTQCSALKLMAEMALRYGDHDYAVLAFVKSATEKGIWLNDDDQLRSLEYEAKNEAYMATWFYGLAHELGHLAPIQKEEIPEGHIFSDAWILNAITTTINDLNHLPDSFKQEAIERAKQKRSKSVIGIDHVRSEGLADFFATNILFKTTFEIMREINQEQFQITQFVHEMVIFFNIIVMIDRCRRVALIASATNSDREAHLELLLQPASVIVRALMQRKYLVLAVTEYLYGAEPTSHQFRKVEELIDNSNKHYEEKVELVEKGLAQAMEFSLFPDRRENDWVLLESFRKDLSNSTLSLLEAKRFCKLADELGADSKLLRSLKNIVDDPSKPLRPNLEGDLIYLVPWIEQSTNEFNRPFGLNTKYGHIVFVFHTQGELYEAFFKSSSEILKAGFTLKQVAVIVPRKEQLKPQLAAHMPSGQNFQIVIEGTKRFEQYMQELAEDTIWGD